MRHAPLHVLFLCFEEALTTIAKSVQGNSKACSKNNSSLERVYSRVQHIMEAPSNRLLLVELALYSFFISSMCLEPTMQIPPTS